MSTIHCAFPLQAVALEALERLERSDRPLLFPAPRGAAGADRSRHFADPPPIYLRHTYATFALRAGVSIFDLSRFMGASLTMIDRHYGHLARDGRQHAVALLDALAADGRAWTFGGR
ncbi:MAG: hypothetical protein H0T97_09425, partial [Actinobacteria bacterium]|nr:hypothetical protein [Actinomycetota bacterium]